jgi:hypothetical protein
MDKIVYISDNLFTAGLTSIENSHQEEVAQLDFSSAFTSKVAVTTRTGEILARGQFKFFSMKWLVFGPTDKQLGILKGNTFSFKKNFTYTTEGHTYKIFSPSFSRDFTITDEKETVVATFKLTNHVLSVKNAFEVCNVTEELKTEEIIIIVMGINAIWKRRTKGRS